MRENYHIANYLSSLFNSRVNSLKSEVNPKRAFHSGFLIHQGLLFKFINICLFRNTKKVDGDTHLGFRVRFCKSVHNYALKGNKAKRLIVLKQKKD